MGAFGVELPADQIERHWAPIELFLPCERRELEGLQVVRFVEENGG